MRLEKEDYIDPACPLCGKPGEIETVMPVPVDRIQRKLWEYEDASDWQGRNATCFTGFRKRT